MAAILNVTLKNGTKQEYKLGKAEVEELLYLNKKDKNITRFGNVEIANDDIKKLDFNDKVCHHCFSFRIECKSQHSDSDGKIVSDWDCLDCKKEFSTRW